jgi:hypothetical protein
MTQLVTLTGENNFAAIAAAMGMGADVKKEKKQSSNLARLKISHSGVMGETDVKGKVKKVEVVEAGSYALQRQDQPTVYSTDVKIRLFNQRFMYKRYVKGTNGEKDQFVKTIMSTDLNQDLRDNTGGFNCGKPGGWIEDYKALPDDTKALLKSIKRVRVLFGEVTLNNAINEKGEEVGTVEAVPFIWEVDNKDAFKTMGAPITQMAKLNRILPQHYVVLGTEEHSLPTGNVFFTPTASLDQSQTLSLTDKDQETFSSFVQWIDSYNEYIVKTFNEAANKKDSEYDEVVDEFVDVEVQEAA